VILLVAFNHSEIALQNYYFFCNRIVDGGKIICITINTASRVNSGSSYQSNAYVVMICG